METEDDAAIIARAQAGEVEAFGGLVRRHETLVWSFCRNLLRNPSDAEDLTQDVFLAAFRRLHTFDQRRAAFGTWLLTIARSLGCQRSRPTMDLDLVRDAPLDHGDEPANSAADGEIWARLDRALESLPLEQRTAFILAEIQELPYREIAVIEGVEVGTVKSRVSRAKARLRTVLHDWQAAGLHRNQE